MPGMTSSLRITEIFYSLQGETSTVGIPTVFIRLIGCPLRCVYCDTAYAFSGGETMSINDIITRTRAYPAQYVTVTGGEPLAQRNCLRLLSVLCDEGYEVSLETGGSIDVSGVDPRVVKVIDVKTPASGEESSNRLENLAHLGTRDQLKFVICDRRDYEWSVEMISRLDLPSRCEVLFSPVHGQLE